MKRQLNQYGSKKLQFIFLSLCLIPLVFFSPSNAQTLSVQGKVTASRFAVQNAAVTFIDNADTTIKFSTLTDATGFYRIGLTTSVEFNINDLPDKFALGQSYPNPFSSSTVIPYQLKRNSTVRVTIYDILGREVRKFFVGSQAAGSHNMLWDGRDNFGKRVASGIYFYKLQAGDESRVGKMIFDSGGGGSASLSPTFFSPLPKVNKAEGQHIQGGTYSVRIENTGNIFPIIISQQVDNVPVRNDTTINFSVNSIATTVVNLDSVHQIIRGFGAANILQWRPDMTDSEIATAFGTGEGQLGLTILRLRIQPDRNQWGINVPTAKKAHDMGALIIASPWSPPASLKTNNNLVDGELREDAYDDYAAHLNSFAEFMANNGVPIYAISVQNEPDVNVTYESCDWNPNQMLKFMKENASAIGTRVMAPESFQFRRAMSDPILNDPVACANLAIVAGHIYGGGLARYPLAEEKGKEVWMTEHLSGETSQANDWSWCLPVAKEINDVMQAGMSAYVWWYIVRFYGPISDGERNCGTKGEATKKGYVMSQYSRFVRPGYYRVDSQSWPATGNVFVTAYKDSSSSKVVLVALNTGSTPLNVAFRIQHGAVNNFSTYTTSVSKNVVRGDDVRVVGNCFMYNLEASSITTFVSN
ncbi:MAG: T9SS type A sorting domain-containing protein [candidate division KSB1 bacterium]|nr:T9SS type A sorting domain-containing protein [candidate division KSB1 bacterium]MDZ7302545.1 T9SS type A sorting domain-containing protein [candidate division KSB1 bacterium]